MTSTTMRAAVMTAVGRPLEITEIAIPRIGPDDVLVRTLTSGLCRTDLHLQDGAAYVPSLPHVPGHEPIGTVEQVGENVQGLARGQRVVPHLFVANGECHHTRAGQHAQATHLEGIIGVTLPGGFAEYFAAPASNLLRVPDNVSDETGGLTSCAIVTAVHAFRRSQLGLGSTAVVIGAGGVGQILLQILVAAGIRAIVVDASDRSRALARANGAFSTFSSTDPSELDRIRDETVGDFEGAHVVFDLVGSASTMEAAAELVMRRGRIVVVGEEADYPAIDTTRIAQRELEIVGSRNGSRQDAADGLRMLSDGVLRPAIGAHFPLAQINEAMDLLRSGEAQGRIIIDVRE